MHRPIQIDLARMLASEEPGSIAKTMTTVDVITADLAAIGVRLLDDAYLAWFSAEGETERALRAWREGSTATHATSYAVYRAALDREEAAARDVERLWELSEPCRISIARRTAGRMNDRFARLS